MKLSTLLASSATALCASNLLANTVAWYHFSEMEPGEASTAETVFENSANPGVMRAVPATTVNERRTDLVGTDAWPEKMVLSPASNGADVGNSGLGFYIGTDLGIVKVSDGIGSLAETDGDASVEKSYTMEFFMQCLSLPTNPTSTGNNQPTTRAVLSRTSSGGAWWKLLINNGAFKFHASTDNSMTENWSFSIGNAANIRKWHHFAVTYDASTRTYSFYADYTKIFAKQLAAKLPVGDAPIVLGGSTQSSSKYGGGIGNKGTATLSDVNFLVDEFRISDEVLQPSQFMGWKLASDSDVAAHIRFDAAATAGLEMFPLAVGWNSAAHPTAKTAESVNSGAVASTTTVNMAVATVHDGIRDAGAANSGALSLVANASNQGARYAIPGAGLESGDFTAEAFVKFDPDNFAFSDDSGYLFEAKDSWSVRFMAGGAVQGNVGGSQFAYINKGYWGAPEEGKNVDGNWHHVAFVRDSAAGTLSLFIDYINMGGTTAALPPAGDGKIYISGAHWNTTQYTLGTALLDEVKVTRRALKPWEFLRGNFIAGPTLLWADFDEGDGLAQSPVVTPFHSSQIASGSGGAPSRSGSVPAQTTETIGNEVVNDANVASMGFPAAGYVWFRNPAVLAPELTIELFVKNRCDGKAGLVALYDGNTVDDAIWGLELDTDGKTPVFVDGAGGSQTRIAFSGAALDSKWHHVALVLKTPASGNSSVKLLVDGESKGEQTLSKRIRQTATTPRVWLGRATNGAAFSGNIDELRISEGELSAVDMMALQKNATIMVFR